jgi:hypothetical protein
MRTQALTFAAIALLAAGTYGCGSKPPAQSENGTVPAQTGDAAPAVPAAEPEPAKPRAVTLEAGTPVVVRTTTALSTNTNTTGESFAATLAQPLVSGNTVIAPKGAEVEGRIAEADKGGRVKGRASIAVRLVSVTTADGERLKIATNTLTRVAPATKKKDAMKVGIGAGIGAAIGAIAGGGKGAAIGAAAGGGAGTGAVLATRGDPARLPAESLLRFTLTAPVTAPVR